MSGEIAQLKTQIQARKFKSMEISGEIDTRRRQILNLMGTSLTKIKDIDFPLIARLAAEAEMLQGEYLTLLAEIEQAEKELAG